MNVSGGGHVIATFGMVEELVARGESVHYFEDERFRAEIEELGATFHPMPSITPYQGPICDYPFHHEFALSIILLWSALDLIPKLESAVRNINPDCIVHDSLCLWGSIIARRLNVRAVCSVHPPAFNARSIMRSSRFWIDLPQILFRCIAILPTFISLRRSLVRKFEIASPNFLEVITNPQKLTICHLPEPLQPHRDCFDQRHHFVGTVHDRPLQLASHFPLESIEQGVILVGFGTICDPGRAFFVNCVRGLSGLGRQVIIILSASTTREDLGEVPSNVIVWSLKEDGLAPQMEILSHASLFVMNGGTGGTREAAWNGVPVLAVPTTFETSEVSSRVKQTGMGLVISPRSSPRQITRAAQKVLDNNHYYKQANVLGNECRLSGGGAPKAADLVIDYMK
jgi:MGT family glycosyltransferase